MGSNPIISTIRRYRLAGLGHRPFTAATASSNLHSVTNDNIAQLVEQQTVNLRVVGSSPSVVANGSVAQLVRALACHARGQGFKSPPSRHLCWIGSMAEQLICNQQVVGSTPISSSI